jgi:DNA polymerase-3 subunit delta'
LGKRDLALRIAASYLCLDRRADGNACGACEACRWLAAGTHPDFSLVEPPVEESADDKPQATAARSSSKTISIEQVRQVGELLALTAHRDPGRTVIIHPAEAMTASAANALLKSLEEPPAKTLFILVSHRPALLAATIRSRCQSIVVRPADQAAAERWLREQGVADAAQRLALCGGAPLEAAAIDSDPSWRRRRDFIERLCEPGSDGVSLAGQFRDISPHVILAWLQTWTLDLALMRFRARVRYHADLSELAARLARDLEVGSVLKLNRRLLALQRHIHHPLNPRLLLEQMLIDCRVVLDSAQGRAR